MIVVCAIDRPRSAIISTRSRRLSLNRRYQRTHRMMTSRSKWRPLNSSSTLFSLPIADPQPFSCQHSRSDRAVCTRAFWSDKHVGTYCPHALPKQMKLLLGVLWDGDLVNTWASAFPDTTVLDWKQSLPSVVSEER